MARMKTQVKDIHIWNTIQRYRWIHTHHRWKIFMSRAVYNCIGEYTLPIYSLILRRLRALSKQSTIKVNLPRPLTVWIIGLEFGQMKQKFIHKICVPFSSISFSFVYIHCPWLPTKCCNFHEGLWDSNCFAQQPHYQWKFNHKQCMKPRPIDYEAENGDPCPVIL